MSAAYATILVVDDEILVRDVITALLGKAGYRVLSADSGHEALSLCRRHTGPIHLALLDVVMPGMKGPELRERLLTEFPSIRTVFISGYSYDELGPQGVAVDERNFIAKPFTMRELLNAVSHALEP